MIQTPAFLQEGDLIVVISPSGIVDKDLVLKGIELLKNANFNVEITPHVFDAHFKYAANHHHRLEDLQFALDHPTAKAVYCARGGFGITHLIDALDWTQFKLNPKWIIGFSDITALLHAAYQNGYCSLHACVLQGLTKLSAVYQKHLIDTLAGKMIEHEAENTFNKPGSASGELVGGNLSLLVHQIGTATALDYSDLILFIEEVAEPLYHIDRMMLQLKRAGKLENLAGLVIGQFTSISEDKVLYGQSVEEIILDHCQAYDFPIGFNFPFGHGEDNVALVHGARVQLRVKEQQAKLTFRNFYPNRNPATKPINTT